MRDVVIDLENVQGSEDVTDKIIKISLEICKSRIDAAKVLGKNTTAVESEYTVGKNLIEHGDYKSGFNQLIESFQKTNGLICGEYILKKSSITTVDKESEDIIGITYVLLVTLFVLAAFLIYHSKNNKKD